MIPTEERASEGLLIVSILLVAFAAIANGVGLQPDSADTSGPTAIEQALIDHVCRATNPAAAADMYQACLSAQLISLRADFGRDLTKLSRAERRTIDSACSGIRTDLDRDAYMACLSAQLGALRSRRKGANPARPDAPAPASPSETDPSPSDSTPFDSPAPQASSATSRSTGLWIGAAVAALGFAVGGFLLAKKIRRRPGAACRVCGASLSEAGALCPSCRHEAAETLRRAAAERADHEPAKREEERRRREQEEEDLRRQKARQDEEARLQQQEQERQQEHVRREEARQREMAASQPLAAAGGEEVFDPYIVLGVSREAGMEAISAAYQEAKAKYAADQVEHLGAELQDHFRMKAQAVERAYRMLTG